MRGSTIPDWEIQDPLLFQVSRSSVDSRTESVTLGVLMRHIWICIIDGCIVRSGPVKPSETMPVLMERLMRTFPHMGSNSVQVISEDGRVFDSELWFSHPTEGDVKPEQDDLLAAIGVVNGFVAAKVHRGMSIEEIIQSEAGSFSGKINDDVDFGIFDFSGDQLASIEDMIVVAGPEIVPEGAPDDVKNRSRQRRARRATRGSRGGRGRRPRREGGKAPEGETKNSGTGSSDSGGSSTSSEAPRTNSDKSPEPSP